MEHQHQPGAKSCQACEAQDAGRVIVTTIYARSARFVGPIMGTITQSYHGPRFRDGRMVNIGPTFRVATNSNIGWAGPLFMMDDQMVDAERAGTLIDVVTA